MPCQGFCCGCTGTKGNDKGENTIHLRVLSPWIKSSRDSALLVWCSNIHTLYLMKAACTNSHGFTFDLVLSSFQHLRRPPRIHLSVNCNQFHGVFCILFCFCFLIKVDPPKPKSGPGKIFIQEGRKNGLSKWNCSFRVVLQNTLIYKAILAVELGHF